MFLDRRPYDGLGLGAAYLGHTYIPDWTSDVAGREDRLENICSGWSIERRLRTPGYVAPGSRLMPLCDGDVSSLTCAMLGEAARGGDPFALDEINRIARSYAIALSNLVTLLAPDVVAIGASSVAHFGQSSIRARCRLYEDMSFASVRALLCIGSWACWTGRFRVGQLVCWRGIVRPRRPSGRLRPQTSPRSAGSRL